MNNIKSMDIYLEISRLKKIEEEYERFKIEATLTQAEIRILGLIYKGYTQSQIADELFISIRTVKNHITNILKKTKEKSSKVAAKKLKGIL